MAKLFYPDFFNDVFGPIMQPGSSGSFAGTSRVGRVARHLLISEPKKVLIRFNPGDQHMKSLGNMMDDRAYLGGLQDFATDDIRLFDAHALARAAGISYEFGELESDNEFPGSVTFDLTGVQGDHAHLVAQSIGGGMIATYRIDGFELHWQADTWAVYVRNAEREILHSLRERAADDLVQTTIAENDSNEYAALYEFSSEALAEQLAAAVPAGLEARILPALLPVVTIRDRKPQLFTTVEEWRQIAETRGISFVQAAVEYEKQFSGWSDTEILNYFEKISGILDHQIHSLEEIGYENAVDTPNLPIYGKNWDKYRRSGRILEDPITEHIIVHAMSTNAKLPGTLIVPGPMGTGGGYLYSAIDAVREAHNIPHEKVIESLIVAAALGAIAFTHAHASGASGCVGESGICCAMASGAIAYLGGGDGTVIEHAASMALQANLGIPCDPIPGGKEFPCITRTIRAAVTAPLYADLALAGIDPLIPYHEVLFAIEENRKRSTAFMLHDGINLAPCAQRCQECFQCDLMADKLRYDAEANRKTQFS